MNWGVAQQDQSGRVLICLSQVRVLPPQPISMRVSLRISATSILVSGGNSGAEYATRCSAPAFPQRAGQFVLYRGVSSCVNHRLPLSIWQKQRVSELALRSARTCTSFFRLSSFYGRSGQRIEPRTTCASLARRCGQPSGVSLVTDHLTTQNSLLFSGQNTASRCSNTSWASTDRNGGQPSAGQSTLATYASKSQSSSGKSRSLKCRSNNPASGSGTIVLSQTRRPTQMLGRGRTRGTIRRFAPNRKRSREQHNW
jgi:hypothetical protein